jgi:PAS domain-containing protein
LSSVVRFFSKELAEKYRADDLHVVDTREILQAVEEHRLPTGERKFVEIIKAPMFNAAGAVTGVQVAFWDVTARKRAEEELSESESRNRAILQAALDSILTIDQQGKIVEFNPAAEESFTENQSSHFTLRFEGKQTSESLRRELITTLEAAYDDLSRDLGGTIRNSIPVVLYTEKAFFDVTQAPAWSSAVNDGKLRIPVEGVISVTPELARVLKHELAHSFINQIAGGRCPQWLHEGIAQAMEPKSVASRGRRLAALYRAHQEIPFNGLEGSFMRFSPAEALLAYDESLATVEYISDTYGMSDLHRILERIGQGSSTEAALRATIHSDYGQLEGEVAKYLSSKYGE